MGSDTEVPLERPGARADGAATQERFVWPPAQFPEVGEEPAQPEAGGAKTDPGEPQRDGRGRPSMVAEIESAWLGVAARSWRAASRLNGWTPDKPGDYCPRCGTSAGPFEADGAGCPVCRNKRLAWSRSIRLGSYEGPLRDAILSGKYTGWRRVCQDLGADLGLAVGAALQEASIPPELVAVCPVTTSRRRRLTRGVDHTAVLAREVARVTGGRLVRGLGRLHRPPQQGLSQEARRRNVAGSFRGRVGACAHLDWRVVVLVDDVRTTGATLSAAARALREGTRKAGVRERAVWAAVLAVTCRH